LIRSKKQRDRGRRKTDRMVAVGGAGAGGDVAYTSRRMIARVSGGRENRKTGPVQKKKKKKKKKKGIKTT